MSTAEVWVRSSSLKDYGGQYLEVGEVFTLRNGLHDDKLLEHRYVIELDKGAAKDVSTCIGCGKRFAGEGYRNAHAMRAQHEAIDVDGPQLKQPKPIDPTAGGPDRELEPVGAPAPTRAEETGAAVDRGSKRGASGPGSKANEVFRLG